MIYYPIDTLRGMGIRQVMVILGGRSIGDIVELLNDGEDFGLDLTYRYQRGAQGIAHAIGLARDFVDDDSFCVVLGDNVLRGPELADVAAEFDGGSWGAGTLLHRVPDPERFGVAEFDAQGRLVGFQEKPQATQERPHPDRRLLPAAGRVRRHRPALAFRPRRVRDHRRAEPLRPWATPVLARVRRRMVGRRYDRVAAQRRHRGSEGCARARNTCR